MRYFISAGMLLLAGFLTGSATAQDVGPIGPSPYEVVESWHKPFAAEGFAFGGSSGVFAESPNRILISQRGETRLPDPVPPEFAGYVGSIGINALRDAELRTWQNCLMVVDGDGNVLEVWDQWDHLCADSDGPGPHRIRISPYDPQRRVWVINETRHQIFVLSNDGSELLMTLGEKNVGGSDQTHFGRPQDVAFLPDGRVLVADGLDNHRIIILDAEGRYQSEFGGFGTEPGRFNGIHALGVGPDGLIFALDRGQRPRPEVPHLERGFRVNTTPRSTISPRGPASACRWISSSTRTTCGSSDLRPLKMVKLDFDGNRLYTWNVSKRRADRLPRGARPLCRLRGKPVRRRQPARAHAEAGAEDGRGSRAARRTAVRGARDRHRRRPGVVAGAGHMPPDASRLSMSRAGLLRACPAGLAASGAAAPRRPRGAGRRR